MIPIRGPTSDMACNRVCLALLKTVCVLPSFVLVSAVFVYILSSYVTTPLYLSYTRHSMSFISLSQLPALTPSYHLYTSDLPRTTLMHLTGALFSTYDPSTRECCTE